MVWGLLARYSPVAVPDKIFGLTLLLDFIDRGHSLRSLVLPQAALPSLLIVGSVTVYGIGARVVHGLIYNADFLSWQFIHFIYL